MVCNETTYQSFKRSQAKPIPGLLITLMQFIFTAMSAFPAQFDPSQPRLLKKTNVPFYKWTASAIMFFSVNMLNNWAFAFNISVPVHIILRSFGSVTTMGAGYLRGKRYSPIQILSVALLTLGVMVSAWADAISKVLSSHSSRHSLKCVNILLRESPCRQKT